MKLRSCPPHPHTSLRVERIRRVAQTPPNIDVASEYFDTWLVPAACPGNGIEAQARDRTRGLLAADDFRRDKDVHFVHQIQVEEAPQQSRPSFHQQVRPATLAERFRSDFSSAEAL